MINFVQAEAECVYDMKKLHETVPKTQFLDYVNRFFDAIMKAVLEADKTSIQREYDFICKSIFLDLDINELTTNLYESFIELREFALKINVDSLADNINSLYNMGFEAPWILELGKWPETAKFVENFFRKTLGSEDFWLKIDELYQKSINLWEDISSTGQKELALILQYDITPFLEEFLNGLENLPGRKRVFSEFVRQFPSYFNQKQTFSRMNEKVCWFLKELHLMEFQAMKRVYGANNIFKKLTNIFFSNWPTEEVYPKSFDEFFQKLHAQVLTVISNIVGPCQN